MPAFVYELVLLIQAGMTVKAAFRKLGRIMKRTERRAERNVWHWRRFYGQTGKCSPGSQKVLPMNGLARRTGVRQYIRLSSFLVQNLKRGNRNLPEKLREEAFQAGEEKLQQGKRLGEEAGTKLLIPMVMLLAVVMLLIMIPVFSGIG